MARLTQRDHVLNFIKRQGSISSWQAYECLGVTQLATRISELKKRGFKFRKERVKTITRYGVKTHFDRYFLVEDTADAL